MHSKRYFIAAAFSLILAALTAPAALAQVTVKQVEGATTVAEFVQLGATKLSAAQFKARVVGKQMSGKGWSWIIDTDGTTSSVASDKSWSESKKPWSLKGNKYCTELQGAVKCRDVYMIGSYLRMSDPKDPKKLATWTAKTN